MQESSLPSDSAILYHVCAMPIAGGPYLSCAFFCDRVLQEHDQVLSAIRIVDRWTVNGAADTMPTTVLQTTLVIAMKSGIYRGNAQLSVTPITPSDSRLPAAVFPVLFEADDERGVGVVLPMGFPAQEPGLYWFEVSLALQGMRPQVITAIPMRVAYLQMVSAPRPDQPSQNGPA